MNFVTLELQTISGSLDSHWSPMDSLFDDFGTLSSHRSHIYADRFHSRTLSSKLPLISQLSSTATA